MIISISPMDNTELFRYIHMNSSFNKTVWVHCPICNGKTRIKMKEDTVVLNFPLFCPKCKRETLVDIVKLKMVIKE